MAEKQPQKTRIFGGDRMMWISPVTLKELLEAKVKYPQALLSWGTSLWVCRTPGDSLWGNTFGEKKTPYMHFSGKTLWNNIFNHQDLTSSALLKRRSQLPFHKYVSVTLRLSNAQSSTQESHSITSQEPSVPVTAVPSFSMWRLIWSLNLKWLLCFLSGGFSIGIICFLKLQLQGLPIISIVNSV